MFDPNNSYHWKDCPTVSCYNGGKCAVCKSLRDKGYPIVEYLDQRKADNMSVTDFVSYMKSVYGIGGVVGAPDLSDYLGPVTIVSVPRVTAKTGFNCTKCNFKNDYAASNQPNGTYVCFNCR